MIDLSLIDKSRLSDQEKGGILKIQFPKEHAKLSIGKLGPKQIFLDPRMSKFVHYPFTLHVIEPVQLYQLKFDDLHSVLSEKQISHLCEEACEGPNEQELIELWYEAQREFQWQGFKSKCVKNARHEMKFERTKSSGEINCRKPRNPKSFKPYPINPN